MLRGRNYQVQLKLILGPPLARPGLVLLDKPFLIDERPVIAYGVLESGVNSKFGFGAYNAFPYFIYTGCCGSTYYSASGCRPVAGTIRYSGGHCDSECKWQSDHICRWLDCQTRTIAGRNR